jgi:hypothetical protein
MRAKIARQDRRDGRVRGRRRACTLDAWRRGGEFQLSQAFFMSFR